MTEVPIAPEEREVKKDNESGGDPHKPRSTPRPAQHVPLNLWQCISLFGLLVAGLLISGALCIVSNNASSEWSTCYALSVIGICLFSSCLLVGIATYICSEQMTAGPAPLGAIFIGLIWVPNILLVAYVCFTRATFYSGIENFPCNINMRLPLAPFYQKELDFFYNRSLDIMPPTLIEGYSGTRISHSIGR